METVTVKYPTFAQAKLYIASGIITLASILTPAALHPFGSLGQMLLPIYFFSLLAGITYGKRCGLLVGAFTPLISFAISGMPILAILPFVLFKSTLIGLSSGILAEKFNGKKLILVSALAVVLTQAVGGILIFSQTQNFVPAFIDIKMGYPGIALQLLLIPFLARKILTWK